MTEQKRPLLHRVEDNVDAAIYSVQLAVHCWRVTLPAAVVLYFAWKGVRS